MTKLSQFAVCVGAALVCAAVPVSFNWTPGLTLFSLDTAEAKVGRPLTATSVAGVNRRVHRRAYRRAAVGAAVVGGAAVGGAAVGGAYVGGSAPASGPGPAVTAAAPYGGPGYGGPGYGYGPGPDPNAVVVNPVTGRWCRTEPGGYQWCWTP